MKHDRGRGLLLAAAVAGGLALGAAGSATGGACEASRRGAELLREGRPAEALEQLDAGGGGAGGCEENALRAYNRALAHARVGRASAERAEAVHHLERARRGFGAVLARDSADDARWNRALVGDWLDRLARERAGGAGGGAAGPGASGAGGRGGDTAGAGGADTGPGAGGPVPGPGGDAVATEGGGAADAGVAAAGQETGGGGGADRAGETGDAPVGAAALEGLLRDASASDRRLRGLILRRALASNGREAGRW